MPTYLEDLTIRLAVAVAGLPEDIRGRHASYVMAAQCEDGGFAGRQGGSDLYYTGFALRSLAVLGELHGELAEKAADFLRSRLTGHESIVDFLSLIYGSALLESSAGIDLFANSPDSWRDAVASAMADLRRDDGGYAKGPQGMASSTYHTFLVVLCLQLIERPLPEPDLMVKFIMSQQAEGGGFREIRASKRAGTNPTAAAIGALRILGALDDETRESTIDFLFEMQNDEGGLRANTRIPIADLLSTFTGTLTLMDLGGADEIDFGAALRFAQSLELEQGGFHGAVWDEADDVEYTFYGLGCLALLGSHKPVN
ncbi:MAG: terpene cyclase/mutase family protein [Pirellulaceae bacterium]|nr:terpene cyclase/mutase family protein [Pirellulaceae bacterium]HJN13553.1 prenyltransferase/squalene oxidase repeat-containing protein [Pirellulaceae bacterium]